MISNKFVNKLLFDENVVTLKFKIGETRLTIRRGERYKSTHFYCGFGLVVLSSILPNLKHINK